MFDPVLLQQIRSRFMYVEEDPFSARRIYLESAGGALRLKAVIDAVASLTALPDNAARDNPASRHVDAVLEQGRQDLALLLGARSGVITIGESTTANAFRILRAIVSSIPGSNIVTTNLDHPAVYDATRLLASWYGKEWRVAGLNPRTGVVEPEEVLRHIDPGTVVLALIHSSNITGATLDLKTIIREARAIKPDLYILVDGAQHAPHGAVDVQELDCCAYLASSYKFFSKMGASCAWLSNRLASLPHDQILGKSKTSWDLGTREAAGYASWTAVVDYLSWLGGHFTGAPGRQERVRAAMQAIQDHEAALAELLFSGCGSARGLRSMGRIRVYPAVRQAPGHDPIAAITVPGMTAPQLTGRLEEEGIRVCARISDGYSKHTLSGMGIEECVRVSLCHYNSSDEVITFLQTLERAC